MKAYKVGHPVWAKMPAISKAMDQYPEAEWIWWLDVDALIMTPSIDLYEYLLNPTVLRKLLIEGQIIRMNERVPMKDYDPKGPFTTGHVNSIRNDLTAEHRPLENRHHLRGGQTRSQRRILFHPQHRNHAIIRRHLE